MKILFTAAIAGSAEFGGAYKKIVSTLKEMDHQVEAEHITKADRNEIRNEQGDEDRVAWYQKVLKMISWSDVVVAEVSTPSLNVGHELSLALEKDKPVVAFYKKGHHPVLWQGLKSDKFYLVEYSKIEDIETELDRYVTNAGEQRDTRFNFFISPKIAAYLDWISKNKRIPRAVYLRTLIENKMQTDKEFEG